MSSGYHLFCPFCGYEKFLSHGSGMLFFKVYEETLNAAKTGELGENIKRFFEEHPDGVINTNLIMTQCENCGEYWSVKNLSTYIPKSKKSTPSDGRNLVFVRHSNTMQTTQNNENKNYLSEEVLDDYYDLVEQYPHSCEYCHGKLKILNDNIQDMKALICPYCKTKLIKTPVDWD